MTALARLSAAVRTYLDARSRDQVLASFLAGFDWPRRERSLDPRRLNVVRYLDDFPTPPTGTDEQMLLAALVAARDALDWRQTYDAADMSGDFLDNYGWVEMFGTRGHFECDTMAGGFLMLGPETYYPDHHHVAEEVYVPLTAGSAWSKDGVPFERRAVGELIQHPSEVAHAMRTASEPLVALYLWRGGPLAQKAILVEGEVK